MRAPSQLRLAPFWPALAAIVVAVVLLASLLPRLLAESNAERLIESARLIEPEVGQRLAEPSTHAALQRWVAELAAEGELRMTVIRLDGIVLADSDVAADRVPAMDNHASRPEVVAARAVGSGWSVRRSDTTRRSYLYAAYAATTPSGERYVLRLAQPVGTLRDLYARLGGVLALALIAALLVTAGISWWLDRRLFHPLAQLIDGASTLARGTFGFRLQRPREPSLGLLADALNRLAGRVEEQIEAVQDDRDHLRAILESMSEGVLVVDSDGRAVLVNDAFRRLFGLRGELEGKRPREITRQPEVAAAIAEALAGNTVPPSETVVTGRGERSVSFTADALRTETGGAILTARDTTELTRVAAMRRDFVANVSHELKTPLAAIRGYAETLADGALEEPETAHRFTRSILGQCRRLQALLDDLLVLSRLESVEAPFEADEIDLSELVGHAADTVARAAEERGVTVRIERGPPAVTGNGSSGEHGALTIQGDWSSLDRLLVNLLDNAVKYNRDGGEVTVRTSLEQGDAVIEVEDTGIGIPSDLQPRIFERFYRVDKGRARDEGGTGLGLAIVKHVAQRHGGEVEIESQPGQGSTFRVRLPVAVN